MDCASCEDHGSCSIIKLHTKRQFVDMANRCPHCLLACDYYETHLLFYCTVRACPSCNNFMCPVMITKLNCKHCNATFFPYDMFRHIHTVHCDNMNEMLSEWAKQLYSAIHQKCGNASNAQCMLIGTSNYVWRE